MAAICFPEARSIPLKRLRNENTDLDPADLKILRLLEKDARTSTAELARSVGLSAPSVAERIKRLQESGVIEAYTVRINPAALGMKLSAWLRIRPVPGQLAVVAEIIRDLPEIAQCDRVTGEDCFIALAHVGSVAELERVIDRIIPHAMTNTAIIQSSPVVPRSPLGAVKRQDGAIIRERAGNSHIALSRGGKEQSHEPQDDA